MAMACLCPRVLLVLVYIVAASSATRVVVADDGAASPRGWLVTAQSKQEALEHSRLAVTRVQASQETLREWFADYKQFYSKQYEDPDREATAFHAFSQNMLRVLQVNADPTQTYWASGNSFSDVSEQEFEATMLGVQIPEDMPLAPTDLVIPESAEEKSAGREAVHESALGRKMLGIGNAARMVDWRMSGKVTPVRAQGLHCGACWAFSAVAAIESALLISRNTTSDQLSLDLSEQQLISCVKEASGCAGGGANAAFNYVAKNNLTTEARYPFTAGSQGNSGTCSLDKLSGPSASVRLGAGVQWGPTRNEQALMALVAKQPVVVYFRAAGAFINYAGGVYSNPDCGTKVNHAMLVVGYMWTGSVEGSAWIVKNSFGPWWGTQGYVRIAMTGDGSPGTCGLNLYTLYPSLKGLELS